MASSPERATRQLRISPGGGIPSSRVSRPDEPPSSATVTTAAISSAYNLAACRLWARPWPPPIPTTFTRASPGSVPLDVAVDDFHAEAVLVDDRTDLLGENHRTMPASGAANRNRQVVTTLLLVAGKKQRKQVFGPHEEVVGRRLPQHVLAHVLVQSLKILELGDPVRVR